MTDIVEVSSVIVVVVQGMGDTVEAVVGPFWEEGTAETWARDTARRFHKRTTVRHLTERLQWTMEQG